MSVMESRVAAVADRVYARAFAIMVRHDGGSDGVDEVDELIALAGHDAHILGRVRDRFELLLHERPTSDHARRALAVVTAAWIAAIEAA